MRRAGMTAAKVAVTVPEDTLRAVEKRHRVLGCRRCSARPDCGGELARMPELFLVVFTQPQPELDARLLQAARDWELTRRQIAVLRELVCGESNKGIAEKLQSAESTVEFHVTTLLRKSNAENRSALVAQFWSRR